MSTEPNDETRLRPKRGAGCLVIGLSVLGLLAVFLVTLVLWQARAARRVDELEAAIRARGEPLSPQELEAFYVLPKGQEDTTGLWLTALAFLDVSGFKQDARDLPVVGTGPDIPPPGQPWPQRAAAEALLDKYQQALQGLHDAADRGGAARYPVPFQDGHNMSLPHVLSLRSGARLLILEAHVQAHRGDAHATAESIHALNRLGGSLEQEPLLVGLLFRVAIGTISTEFCGQMLPHVRFSDEDLRRLSDDYRAARYDEGYRRALVAERVLGIMAFENPKASRDELPPRGGLTYNEDQALYLELMDAAIAAAQKPFPQAEEESQAILYRLPRGTKTGLNKPRFPRTKLLFPPLTAYLEATTRGNAQSEAALTAIAIERFRRQHGELPQRLEAVVPDFLPQLPVDPFDGQPLRYMVQPDQYLLYSVGQDGVDNGGQDEPRRDVVLRVRKVVP